MKVLVACEFSDTVSAEFRRRGHDVTSCDILPSEGYGTHYKGDVMDIINDGWDMMIAFPPCTHLASSGAMYWQAKQADGRQTEAIEFVQSLYNAPISKVAIENPVGILSTIWKKPNQIIHPYHFGDPYMKRTCLWLRGLPVLLWPEAPVKPTHNWTCGSQRGGEKKDGTRTKSPRPSLYRDPHRRSRSFKGIARAMADQWG